MSSDETLYSRQNSKEIDEALAWLESLGDSATTQRSSRQAEPTAFLRLPTWLKHDIRLDYPQPAIDAPPVPDDNLSWLDAIASGSGGVSEEPPTMQWESGIEAVPEDEPTELLSSEQPNFTLDEPTHVSMERPSVDAELAIEEDEPTELLSSEQPDFTLDEPTHVSMERPSVDAELAIEEDEPTELLSSNQPDFGLDAPTQVSMHRPPLDDELTAIAKAVFEAQDEPTALLPSDEPDFLDLDAPTHLLTKQSSVSDELEAGMEDEPTDALMRPISVDDERTTTIVPSVDMPIEPVFEPTNVTELTDETLSLIGSAADFEPTTLILPENVEQVPSSTADLSSDEPTNLLLPEPQEEDVAEELTSLLPPLPPAFEDIEPFEPTNFIEADEEVNSADFEPTYLLQPDAEDDNDGVDEVESDTHFSETYDTRPSNSQLEEIKTSSTDLHPNDFEPTQLFVPAETTETPISEISAESDTNEPVLHPNDFEPTQLFVPIETTETPIHEISAELDTNEPVLHPNDFEPTALVLPKELEEILPSTGSAERESVESYFRRMNDFEPTALVLPDDSSAKQAPSEKEPFEEKPTELFFDEFAAMAADVGELTTPERTEIILPTSADVPDLEALALENDVLNALEEPIVSEAIEEETPTHISVEQSIEGLGFYEDEPTEPSLVRPPFDELADEPTQFISPENKAPSRLFEPTIVSEISIADRWRAIPTQFRPRTTPNKAEEPSVVEQPIQPDDTANKLGHLTDDIPDDPDETIAWLEEMARLQKLGGSLEKADSDQDEARPEFERPAQNRDRAPEEPEISTGGSILDAATNEQLPANFFDSVDEVRPTIMADVGESAEEGMDAFVRQVNEVLDDEREPIETLSAADERSVAKSEEELSDALAWLEELVTGTDEPLDEMTIELNETDVNRLLNSYRPTERPPSSQGISDHPTLITHHPAVSKQEPGDELDAALSWLEGLNFDDESNLIEPVEAPATLVDYSAARNSARHAFLTNSYPEAITIFEDLLQREDRNATDIVIEDLVEWTSKVKDYMQFYRLLGDAYLQIGDHEKAAWTFRRGLTI